MGLAYKPLAVRDLTESSLPETGGAEADEPPEDDDPGAAAAEEAPTVEPPLTIPEAKRRLSATLGVPESAIRISVEH